jgi:hypothetical protein
MTVDVSTIDYTSWLEEDMDCPLCMEELDITDRLFKPCECGYQVNVLCICAYMRMCVFYLSLFYVVGFQLDMQVLLESH